jgi:hypothetical protein
VSDVELKRWAETWERAGREMTLIRRRELEHMTDEQAKSATLDLLTMPLPEGLPARRGSGLVDQQRLFSRLLSHR